MSDTVFILGAGASRSCGAPLMIDFLDKARELVTELRVGQYPEEFKHVFAGISDLQRVHSKSELDIVNLESVFGAFEMSRLLDVKFPSMNLEPAKLVASMRQVRSSGVVNVRQSPVS